MAPNATTDPPRPPITAEPVLELRTLDPVERPYVTIDGTRYDLAVATDFGIGPMARLEGLVTRLVALQDQGEAQTLTRAEADELARILAEGTTLVLRAPDRIHKRLDDWQRLAIIEAFTQASRRARPKANRAQRRKASRSIGARPSRVSRASTGPTSG